MKAYLALLAMGFLCSLSFCAADGEKNFTKAFNSYEKPNKFGQLLGFLNKREFTVFVRTEFSGCITDEKAEKFFEKLECDDHAEAAEVLCYIKENSDGTLAQAIIKKWNIKV